MKEHQARSVRGIVRRVCLVAMLAMAIGSWACDRSSLPGPSPQSIPPDPGGVPPPSPGVQATGPTGSYLVTLTASQSCTMVADRVTGQQLPFPNSVRVRQYDGEFTNGTAVLTAKDGTANQVHLGGTDNYAFQFETALMFMRDDTLTIIVPGNLGRLPQSPCAGGDYWWEPFGEQEVFELCGTWEGAMYTTQIEGAIDGVFAYYKGGGPNHATNLFCLATDHRFTLTRK